MKDRQSHTQISNEFPGEWTPSWHLHTTGLVEPVVWLQSCLETLHSILKLPRRTHTFFAMFTPRERILLVQKHSYIHLTGESNQESLTHVACMENGGIIISQCLRTLHTMVPSKKVTGISVCSFDYDTNQKHQEAFSFFCMGSKEAEWNKIPFLTFKN